MHLSSPAVANALKVDVMVVGCGLPGKGMGWYHGLQILNGDIPSAKLTDIVEPWLLGEGRATLAGEAFRSLVVDWESKGVKFHDSLETVASPAAGARRVAILSCRTADNPRILNKLIEMGCTCVYLEKPGAPSATELEQMAAYAKSKNVPIYVGYNKNVSTYVEDTLSAEKAVAGAKVEFYHNNAYQKSELLECFERNAEGLLKNMACHELALAVTYFGVRVDNIVSIEPDTVYSSCQTLGSLTDFDALGFTLTTAEGKQVSIFADRCGDVDGGGFSEAVVKNGEGVQVGRFKTPDDALRSIVDTKQAANPGWMPYFFLQHDDYITLKERVCAAVLAGGEPVGVATAEIAIEVLKVAEYLTSALKTRLLEGPPLKKPKTFLDGRGGEVLSC